VCDDAGVVLQSIGDWLSAYQRVTHYLRALDVWQPPPHLLALAVLERALSKADGDRGVPPLRLAMDEVHTLLGQQVSVSHDPAGAGLDWRGSVCWRIGSWLADGAKHEALRDPSEIYRLRPVPAEAPGPMVPQPFEASPLTRAVRALTTGIRVRVEAAWLRRHA
jgi:hypothetical protein